MGIIIAALIASSTSFFITMLSKENKISDFRQQWIDSLREDLANYASILIVMYDKVNAQIRNGVSLQEIMINILNSDINEIRSAEIARLKILYRLNPREHEDLILRINEIYDHNIETEFNNPNTIDNLINQYNTEVQKVLKKEWKRVKKGEPLFRFVKFFTLILVFILIVLGVLLYLIKSNLISRSNF